MGSETTGKLKVILTGATGMVGEGDLHECLKMIELKNSEQAYDRPRLPLP